jgi:GT2 family glycosyltransferase
VDWCLRAKKAGWQIVFVPSAMIYHKQSQSTKEYSFPYIYYHSRNGLILGSRFGATTLTYLLSLWIFTKQLIKLFIGYNKIWAKPVIKGIVDFWLLKRGKLEGYY